MDKKIKCPLLDREIEETECFDIHMVFEDGAPLWSAPNGLIYDQEHKMKCLACPNHQHE